MKNREKFITLAVAGILLVAVVLVIVVSRDDGAESENGSDATAVTKEGDLAEPGQILDEGEDASVTMETTEGSFTIALDTERAPITANSFAYLTEEGFYDGLGFHRIVPGFVIQGGDPLGDGTGDPGFKVVEAPPEDLKYEVGVVAMAKSAAEAPGTSGSQFYVVTGPQGATLTPDYALVGEVTEGLDVVQEIGELGTPDSPTGEPTKEVVIEKATLERG
ncbi:MAG: peptidylprolyl isomerase [Actinomycetota bacterium]|nr:peptidylprolyl isomerase [Actinomycetota bacterium]